MWQWGLAVLLMGAIAPSTKGPTIVGGSDADRKAVADALSKLPACWENAGGSPPKIVIGGSAILTDVPPTDTNAFYVPRNTPTLAKGQTGDLVWILSGEMTEVRSGWHFGRNGLPAAQDTYELLVHELSHRVQAVTPGADATVRRFLAIRYRKLHDQIVSDREYQKLIADQAHARDDAQWWKDQDDIAELAKGYGLPEREDGDAHALDNDGMEYFAIAIEELASHPESFCKDYSTDEVAFLVEHFGYCLTQMPGARNATCFDDAETRTGRGPAGASAPRDATWLKR